MIPEHRKLAEIVNLFNKSDIDVELKKRLDQIGKRIGFDIPADVSKLINLYEKVNDPDLPWLFDSDIFSIDEIEAQYRDTDSGCSLSSLFDVDKDFNVSNDHQLELFNISSSEGDDTGEIIKNIARFLPIGQERGDYLVIDLVDSSLASIELSTSVIFMAPSIASHLNDLLQGVEAGHYKFDDHGDLDYPRQWRERFLFG